MTHKHEIEPRSPDSKGTKLPTQSPPLPFIISVVGYIIELEDDSMAT